MESNAATRICFNIFSEAKSKKHTINNHLMAQTCCVLANETKRKKNYLQQKKSDNVVTRVSNSQRLCCGHISLLRYYFVFINAYHSCTVFLYRRRRCCYFCLFICLIHNISNRINLPLFLFVN